MVMSATTVQKLPKPQLRGLLRSYLKKHLTIAVVLSVAAGYAWKALVADPRKKAYAEFYKTYDPDEHYEAMKKAGVLPDFPKID